jgi:hypothetical protein
VDESETGSAYFFALFPIDPEKLRKKRENLFAHDLRGRRRLVRVPPAPSADRK